MPRGAPPAPTWWLLVELDLPGLTGYRARAIGPLSWTDVRELGDRWERAFGAGTATFTERPGPVPRRVAVGVRVEPVMVERPADEPAPVRTCPTLMPRAERTAAPRPTRVAPAPTAKRRTPGPSRLTDRARAAMARTRAARAAIDASCAGAHLG